MTISQAARVIIEDGNSDNDRERSRQIETERQRKVTVQKRVTVPNS